MDGGGGEISPNVEGWLHLTTDGGKSWSGRISTGLAIRSILFLTDKTVGLREEMFIATWAACISPATAAILDRRRYTNSEMGACAQHAIAGAITRYGAPDSTAATV